ncbi:MAG: Epoxyqueuosine reductase [Chloroflexi bacterium]|nr:Epoxyqueuosine reductase [Chloroflexota bacterium]
METTEVVKLIENTILNAIENKECTTAYCEPIIGFVSAHDPEFITLSGRIGFHHFMPQDLLEGARTVVCFYLPFEPEVVYANQRDEIQVARAWGVAYHDTNNLLGEIASQLIAVLNQHGIRAAAEPSTGNFDKEALKSHWSHKSVAVIAGLGSFGLHQMVITDAGCTGRFGTVVIDAELPIEKPQPKERCQYYEMGACMDCLFACPVNALFEDEPFDRAACWKVLLENANEFLDLGDDVQVCGKCAVVGPCAFESAL